MNNPYIKNLLDRISTILRDKFLPISVNSVYEMKFHCLCVNNLSLNEFFLSIHEEKTSIHLCLSLLTEHNISNYIWPIFKNILFIVVISK